MHKIDLTDAGLTQKQSAVYLACLELGPSKIPAIAREAKLKRTTVYGVVDELVASGLLESSYRGKQKLYRAIDPKTIIALLERRKKHIQELLPELSHLYDTNHTRPRILFFEDREGVRKIYDDALQCNSKQIRMVAQLRQHSEAVGDAFIKEFIRKRVARGIVAKVLHPKTGDSYNTERGLEDPKFKRQVRYLPPNAFYAAIIMIYDRKVAMISTKEENFGFLIESKEFSNTLSAYFDFMWGLGSKEPDFD